MVDSLINALKAFILSADPLALAAGLLLGVVVVSLIRAQQAWTHRREYGYDVYRADAQRFRLRRLALVVGVVGIIFIGLAVFIDPVDSPDIPEPLSQAEIAESLADMEIFIPAIAVQTNLVQAPIVANQWDVSTLYDEVAHLEGTALPGEPGNAVLAAHVTIPNAGWGPFQELDGLRTGDRIFIDTVDNTFVYDVGEIKVVSRDAVEVAYPTDDTRLTLITCTGWDGTLESYVDRLVVVAFLAQTE